MIVRDARIGVSGEVKARQMADEGSLVQALLLLSFENVKCNIVSRRDCILLGASKRFSKRQMTRE